MKENHSADPDGKYHEPSAPEEETIDLGHLPRVTIPPTNDLALVSFLAGLGGWALALPAACTSGYGLGLCFAPIVFIVWAVALFAGFTARGRIISTGEEGADLANWGMIAAGTGIALGTIATLLVILFALLGFASFGAWQL